MKINIKEIILTEAILNESFLGSIKRSLVGVRKPFKTYGKVLPPEHYDTNFNDRGLSPQPKKETLDILANDNRSRRIAE